MSVVIGAKNNLVKTDKNNTLIGVNTFEGNTIFNGGVEGLVIGDVENLQTKLDEKSTLAELQTETDERENADITLQSNINLKADQTSLDTEITNRINADTTLQNNINLKADQTALQTEINEREGADTTLQNNINLKADQTALDAEINERVSADITLQSNIDLKADQTALQTETNEREGADTTLQTNIDLKADQTALDAEIINRLNADTDLQTQINLKLNEANSVYFPNYTKYVVDNRDNIQDVINSITNQASVVYISQGSFGGDPLTINKQNIALIAPSATPPIMELLMDTTTAITADRVRLRYLSCDGTFTAGSSRSTYNFSTFNGDVLIVASQTAGYMTFNSCEFASGKEINVANDFASVVYFINCNFSGCSFSLNQFSNQQIVFSNCAGFVSFPTNAFYAGINTLTSGYTQNTITKTILATGAGTSGQVLTSGGAGGVDSWTTPSGGEGGNGGVCIESIQELCQGQSIITKNGDTLTLPNITAVIKPNQTGGHTILASVPYQPPSGTKSVMLTFKMFIGWNGLNGSCNALFDCRVNSTSYFGGVISSQSFIKSDRGMGEIGEYEINCLMNVDSSLGADNLPNGKIKTWNTPYTFNFASSRTIQNSEVFLCSNNPHPYNIATDKFIVPMIIIKAYS